MSSIQESFAMKKRFRRVLGLPVKVAALALCSWHSAQAQVPLNEYYQQSYRVHDAEGWYWENTDGTNVSASTSWNETQNWLLMPTYPGSTEFVIANAANGSVLDRYHSGNIYVNGVFNGGNNQIFYIEGAASPDYLKFVPVDSYSAGGLDRCKSSRNRDPFDHPTEHRNNIYVSTYRGYTNQIFELESADQLGDPQSRFTSYVPNTNGAPPQPSPPTDLNGSGVEPIVGVTFMGETVVPFVFVKDSVNGIAYSTQRQVTETPYYKIQKHRYWKQLGAAFGMPAGVDETYVLVATAGITATNSSEVAKTLGVSFSGGAELTFASLVGGKLAASLGASFGIQTKRVATLETSSSTSVTDTLHISATCPSVFAYYQLTDGYDVTSFDGRPVVSWEVGHDVRQPYAKTLVSFRSCPGGASGRMSEMKVTKLGETPEGVDTRVEY